MITNDTILSAPTAATFASVVRDAIEQEDSATATDTICRAHAALENSREAQFRALVDDVKSTTARLRAQESITATLHQVAASELLRTARLDAFAQEVSRKVGQVRRVLHTATDGERGADEMAALLADLAAVLAEPELSPEFPPEVVAFVPEPATNRVGQFESEDGAVTAGYPLVGWSLVVRQGKAQRQLEPTFLLEGRTMPESGMQETYGMRLRRIL